MIKVPITLMFNKQAILGEAQLDEETWSRAVQGLDFEDFYFAQGYIRKKKAGGTFEFTLTEISVIPRT